MRGEREGAAMPDVDLKISIYFKNENSFFTKDVFRMSKKDLKFWLYKSPLLTSEGRPRYIPFGSDFLRMLGHPQDVLWTPGAMWDLPQNTINIKPPKSKTRV